MKKYQRVKMLNNKYSLDGICKDAVGYILEIYDKNYCEVEFSDENGFTVAIQAINREDFIVIDG